MTASRLLRPARLILAAAVIVTGCAGTGGNKAGGPTTLVVLRMASANGEAGYYPGVDDLLNRVDALSNGNLRIEMALGVGGFKPDAEQQVVQGVADGTYDLGVVGTRVFDTMGVNSFRALTAPMLIDSYGLEGAVIASDIPTSMLRSLDQLHVAGLGIMGDGLEKPIGTVKALLGPNDWRGIGFGVNRSGAIASAIDALGAKAHEVIGPERDQALKEAAIQGFEMNLFRYRRLDLIREAPYITSNVNLWPQTLAIIGRPDRLASLGVTAHPSVVSAAIPRPMPARRSARRRGRLQAPLRRAACDPSPRRTGHGDKPRRRAPSNPTLWRDDEATNPAGGTCASPPRALVGIVSRPAGRLLHRAAGPGFALPNATV